MGEISAGDAGKPTPKTAASARGSERALVLDFGSQYSRLIVRRLREIGVYSELRRCDIPLKEIEEFGPAAVILSGGPSSVYEGGSPHVAASFFTWAEQQKIPVLGICYGMQEICHVLGGEVQRGTEGEFGCTYINIHPTEQTGEAAAYCRKSGAASNGISATHSSLDHTSPSGNSVSNGSATGNPASVESIKDGTATTQQHSQLQLKGTEDDPRAATHKQTVALSAQRENGEAGGGLFDGCEDCESEESGAPARKKSRTEGNMLVWMSHGDKVTRLPPGFTVLASGPGCAYAAIGDVSRRFYGLQFHPEVTHTPHGAKILSNFVLRIAGMSPSWTMKSFLQSSQQEIRRRVGEEAIVLGALSGGVDSTVAAALVSRAIGGKRFRAVIIDTGLLRQNEAEETLAALKSIFVDSTVDCINAHAAFLAALEGVRDPEEKRKRIGRIFVEQFEAYVNERKIDVESTFLLQGTLYPDVIESISHKGPSHTIKTHHNVGGLPEKMKMKVLEPLRELFKDEVRKLGLEMGLPYDRLYRHPFPGPGLSVRIVGEVTAKRLAVLRQADAIFTDEIKKAGLYNKIAQAFVVLLPDAPSVGVMGDCRTYEWTCVLRAVDSSDYMTADWTRLPYDVVARVSSRIINEVRGINRVVMDVSSKPPATIEWE